MISIDGSYGEGGGQILRTSLCLSLVTGKAFRIYNIRAGRKKPGLMHQHLTSLRAAAEIGRAEVSGDGIGSASVSFTPKTLKPGNYHFNVGTAGSCSLVLQTVLPALMTAEGPSELILEGGTHNPFAPPFDFLVKSFLPVINKIGPMITASLERPGFYPAGRGKFSVSVQPSRKLKQIDICERGKLKKCMAKAMVAELPRKIADRELKIVREQLSWDAECLYIEDIKNSKGPGNILSLEVESENITEVFTGFGERGVSAEKIAARAVKSVQEYLSADVPVGKYLADQLLIPAALAGGGRYKTLPPTLHTLTNIEILKKFMDISISVKKTQTGVYEIES